MDNRYKVRHYNNRIYNPFKEKILKALLAAAAVGLFFLAGWLLYDPLMQSMMEKNNEINSEIEIDKPEKTEVVETERLSFIENGQKAATVPEEALYNDLEYANFLSGLDDDITAVVLDLKTRDGTVTYRSTQKSVESAGSVSDRAVDIADRVEAAKSLGLYVAGRIFAFEDHTAPYNASDMAIRYMDAQGVLWLDDSFDNGGKAWLNPYSETAQKYILDIVYDALDIGFDAVIVDGVRFPESDGQQYAYYGGESETVSKNEILSKFMQRLYSSCAGSTVDVILSYDEYQKRSGGEIYGGKIDEFTADGFMPVITLTQFVGNNVISGVFEKEMPEDVTALSQAIVSGYAGRYDVIPVITLEGLSKDNLVQFKAVLKNSAIENWVLEYSDTFYNGPSEEPDQEGEPEPEAQPEAPSQYEPYKMPETMTDQPAE